MSWLKIIVFLHVLSVALSINRPVYKVALTQKGFAQVRSTTFINHFSNK